MSRTRLLLLCLTTAIALNACGANQQSTIPPTDPAQAQSGALPGAPISPMVAADSGQPSSIASTTNDSSAPGSNAGDASSDARVVAPETVGVPNHIPTWAMDQYYSEGSAGTAAQVRQYVSYAEGGIGNSKAVSDCPSSSACRSVFYFDPSLLYYSAEACGVSGDTANFLKLATESWYVHLKGYTDSAHRVYNTYDKSCKGKTSTIPVYALNGLNASVRSYFTTFLHTYGGAFDYWFMDNAKGNVVGQFYGPSGGMCHNVSSHLCSTTQEVPTDAAVVSMHADLANGLTHTNGTPMTGFYNSLSFTNGEADLNILSSSSHFTGAVCESCVVSLGTFRPTMYALVLNTMAKVNATPSEHFVLLSQGTSPAGSAAQIAQRNIAAAIAWLGFAWSHTIVFPNLEANTTQLNIFPEYSLFPGSPVQTMSSGATNLQVQAGVYRREFASCYNAGVAIGPCAAIVNATGSNVVIRSTWFKNALGHVVQLVGGTIPQGGHTALTTTRFVPNSTYIAPAQGMLIVR